MVFDPTMGGDDTSTQGGDMPQEPEEQKEEGASEEAGEETAA